MNSELVKESLGKYSEVLSFNYPAVGWYFSSEKIKNSFILGITLLMKSIFN